MEENKNLEKVGKFVKCLTETGSALLQKRAVNLAMETKEVFEDEKRRIEKEIRALNNEITSLEDLSVKSTQTLIVGESLNTTEWVKRRFNIELKLRDLRIELETIEKLTKEYFE